MKLDYLTISSVYYRGVMFGFVMKDGSSHAHGRCSTEQEAIEAAMRLAEHHGVEFHRAKPSAYERAQADKAARAAEEAEKFTESEARADIEFEEGVVAVPTAGGILADLPLSGLDRARFPDAVCLAVTKRAAADRRDWVVVEYKGRGVAMHEYEAAALGLQEAEYWVPDLRGVSCVPAAGEIEKHLNANDA